MTKISLQKPYMKNAVHDYYENLIWRMLFMIITKILLEECCPWLLRKSLHEECRSWLLRKSYTKNVVYDYYENLVGRTLFMTN